MNIAFDSRKCQKAYAFDVSVCAVTNLVHSSYCFHLGVYLFSVFTAHSLTSARKHVTVEMKDDIAVVRMDSPGSKVTFAHSFPWNVCVCV